VKITYDQTFEKPLAHFGAELVQMIKDRTYDLIAGRFGYALAFDRSHADAIASDIELCLTEEGRTGALSPTREARILVKYFKQPNDSNLFGLVECFLPLDQDGGELLAELIVTISDNDYYVTLEDVSYAA
jgi:hypothetical protein